MKVREKNWIRYRIYLVAVFFVSGLAIVLARAFQLQVLDKDRLESIARGGYIGTVKLPPKRGTIFDREGHQLALSVEVGSVYAHPKQIKEKGRTAKKLSKVLKKSHREILGALKSHRTFVWIERRIPTEQAKQIQALQLKGIGVTTETRRYYTGKEIAAHLIGFVGTENQGLEGLEKRYDHFLKGPECSLIRMRDALARPFSISAPVSSGQEMHDLVLTIDKDIQYKAQQALQSAVKKTRARGGHCLVVNPDSGEILAMAVVPEFNPNAFSNFRPHQWRNRTVADCFEPGSTIKAFLLAACLEEAVANPLTRFDCERGKYKVGSHLIRDTHEYEVMTVSDIIVHSSNIGAIKMGQKLGYRKFYDYLSKFGFGTKTEIDLLGEREGFVRPPQEARMVEKATAFFGQGMTVTSLQLTMAMAAIANGGKLMRPYVVKAIVNKSGRTVKENHPKVVRQVISPKTARKTAEILEGVVSEEGTGPRAAISGFRVAGKTGTSQKVDPKTKMYSRSKYVGTFVGFMPADRPRLVILVVIDEPKANHYGGVVAAPAFSQVGLWSLNYLRINPQFRVLEARAEPREAAGKKHGQEPVVSVALELINEDGYKELDVLPSFEGLGMREVLKKLRSLGLKAVLEGTGLAFKQEPEPGFSLENVRSVKVCFRPPS